MSNSHHEGSIKLEGLAAIGKGLGCHKEGILLTPLVGDTEAKPKTKPPKEDVSSSIKAMRLQIAAEKKRKEAMGATPKGDSDSESESESDGDGGLVAEVKRKPHREKKAKAPVSKTEKKPEKKRKLEKKVAFAAEAPTTAGGGGGFSFNFGGAGLQLYYLLVSDRSKSV